MDSIGKTAIKPTTNQNGSVMVIALMLLVVLTLLGLAESGRWDDVQNMVDNFAHEIDTWGYIPNGNRSYYLGRSQPPFFAMMVELLCAGLIGEGFSFEAAKYDTKDGGPPRGGEFILAMDPDRFGDAEGWRAHAEGFFAGLTALDGVRLPGDRRYANRARSPQDGIEIPASLHEKILELTATAEA